jgi:alpha-glucuronidase
MAWDPTLTAEAVTREWVDATWSPADQNASDALVTLLLGSWEAYENYTSPLGLGFICGSANGGDGHYAPDPAHRQGLTNATKTHLGYDRSAYAATYNGRVAKEYGALATVPDELLLTFHNVPYTHKLGPSRHGGLSVLEWIYASHKAGAATAVGYVPIWDSLKGRIETEVYGAGAFETVRKRLVTGASEAQRFSGIVIKYFEGLTGIPPAAD